MIYAKLEGRVPRLQMILLGISNLGLVNVC